MKKKNSERTPSIVRLGKSGTSLGNGTVLSFAEDKRVRI